MSEGKNTHHHKSWEVDAKAVEERGFRGVSVTRNILQNVWDVSESTADSLHHYSRRFPTCEIPTRTIISLYAPAVEKGAYLELCEYSECLILPNALHKWFVVAVHHRWACDTCAVR
jgi:hypothetical protein